MMFGGRYQKRLMRDLIRWQHQGWLDEEARQQILHDVSGSRHAHLSTTFALLGALLLGMGVITFIAANWQQLSGMAKLLIGLSTLWANVLLLLVLDQRQHSDWLYQGLVLLLVILFGANIMLIAQTFHINAHWPNGILLWGSGAVLISLVLNTQVAMVMALLLGMLWSGGEALGFERLNWLYPVFLGLVAVWIVANHWSLALRFWGLSLFWWLGLEVLVPYEPGPEALQLLWLLGFVFLFGGLFLAKAQAFVWTSSTFVVYGALAVLGMGWLLSFPELLNWGNTEAESWVIMRSLVALMVMALGLLLIRELGVKQMAPWLALQVAAILMTPEWFTSNWVPVLFNLCYFLSLLLLIWQASMVHNRFLQSIALGFFSLSLLGRYFDTFWDLMDRSLFFTAGGLLLLIGGWWFARKRAQRVE